MWSVTFCQDKHGSNWHIYLETTDRPLVCLFHIRALSLTHLEGALTLGNTTEANNCLTITGFMVDTWCVSGKWSIFAKESYSAERWKCVPCKQWAVTIRKHISSLPFSYVCVCLWDRGTVVSLHLNEDFLSFSFWGVFPEKGLPSPGGRTSCYREPPGTNTHAHPLAQIHDNIWRMHLCPDLRPDLFDEILSYKTPPDNHSHFSIFKYKFLTRALG